MTNSNRAGLFLSLALAAALGASPAQAKSKAVALYLDNAWIAAQQFAPAPAPGSDADKADLAVLHAWQDKRTTAQCVEAQSQAHASFDEFFGDISPLAKPLPQEASDFLGQVGDDVAAAVGVLKEKNLRPRPFWRDPTLGPCLGRIRGLAYPSGHAAISRVYALLLGELAPQRREEFLVRADAAALNRVIGGVHHPTDIAAGKRLADGLYEQFLRDPAFNAQVERLRADLAK
jgi:acid phosphatase (class A)